MAWIEKAREKKLFSPCGRRVQSLLRLWQASQSGGVGVRRKNGKSKARRLA